MLKVNPNPTFQAPVEIPVPGGKPVKIMVQFKHMPTDRAAAYFDAAKAEGQSDLDTLADLIEAWEGVEEPYSRDVLDAVLRNYGGAGLALMRAYFDELHGARRGN